MSRSEREGDVAIMGGDQAGGGDADVSHIHVVIHPLVLLSAVDHYNRIAKGTNKRVVGVLLGSGEAVPLSAMPSSAASTSGEAASSDTGAAGDKAAAKPHSAVVDATNAFAVPFEEDQRKANVWYLDHNFLETMFRMQKKVDARERIVGFYSTGPKLKENDIKIDALVRKFCPNPVFVIIDVRPDQDQTPVTAYFSVEQVAEEGGAITRTFKHVASSVGAYEHEEIGVEHLLRDVNDPSVSSLANSIQHKMASLGGLQEKIGEIQTYLEHVRKGDLPANNQVVYNLQQIVNLLPNLNVDELVSALLINTNDAHLVIYVSSLIRCVVALHSLLSNKIEYADMDDDPATKKKKLLAKEKAAKEKAAKEKEEAEKEGKTKGKGKK